MAALKPGSKDTEQHERRTQHQADAPHSPESYRGDLRDELKLRGGRGSVATWLRTLSFSTSRAARTSTQPARLSSPQQEGVDLRVVLVEAPDDADPEFVRPRVECGYSKAVRRRINVSADLGFA